MLDLERAHDKLRHACRLLENGAQPVIDLRPAARALEAVHEGIYAAFDDPAEKINAARRAIEAVDHAIGTLASAVSLDAAIGFAMEYLRETRAALIEADTRLAPLVPRAREAAPDLRASNKDVLSLHVLDRAVLVPALKVPEPEPPPPPKPDEPALLAPQTFEEIGTAVEQLKQRGEARRAARKAKEAAAREKIADAKRAKGEDAELPPGFKPDFLPALTELQFIASKTRECFDEVAMIGTQRAPLLGDPWRGSLFLERRMLFCIDAIAAMGSRALAQIEPLVMDSPAKDPSRAFAAGVVFGCIDGRDALAAAERVFLALEAGEPEFAVQFGEALKLVPHPLLPLTVRTFGADADPTHRALAIDVLACRGMASVDELARAAMDVPEVARVALPHFAQTSHPMVKESIDRALEQESEALRVAAWRAMALSGHPHAASILWRELEGPLVEHAAIALALVGGQRDAERLLEQATATPCRPLVTAVGWAGAAAAVPALMGFLQHEDDAVKLAAAYALDRITGAGMFDDAEVTPEEIQVPDVPEPDVGERPIPLAQLVSDPRDMPDEGSPEIVKQPTVSLERWKAYWLERGPNFDVRARYRRGHPYTPLVSLRELDAWTATPGERRLLQAELMMRTRGFVRTDPQDFVVVQEAAMKEWEPIAARASGQPGTWTLPVRR